MANPLLIGVDMKSTQTPGRPQGTRRNQDAPVGLRWLAAVIERRNDAAIEKGKERVGRAKEPDANNRGGRADEPIRREPCYGS